MKKFLLATGVTLALASGSALAACAGVGVLFHSEYCAESGNVSAQGSQAQGGSGAALIGIAGQASTASANTNSSAGQFAVATPFGGATAGASQTNGTASQGSVSGALGLAAAGGSSSAAQTGFGASRGAATGGILSIGGFVLP